MLTVKTPDEVFSLIAGAFPCGVRTENTSLLTACSRVLAEDVMSRDFVPGFDRSTVDGYAVRSADTFGCSDALPAILEKSGEVLMGEDAETELEKGCCVAVPTGGAVPPGADAVVMIEYTEDFGDGTIGVAKSVAPGANMIYKGDDVRPGRAVLTRGRKLSVPDIGTLAAIGCTEVRVFARPRVGIISTGDELIPVEAEPVGGQIRDVNSALLTAMVRETGAEAVNYGILKDNEALLEETVERALQECDVVLISGGSSVGMKDATCRVIEKQGEVLLHGIAMKPGKPTILGRAGDKPVFGLPGHPVAAFFVAELFVKTLLWRWMGYEPRRITVPARITEKVGANHGRAQYGGVRLTEQNGALCAVPIHTKSGLITSLAGADGYFCISRDCEGVAEGDTVDVTMFSMD